MPEPQDPPVLERLGVAVAEAARRAEREAPALRLAGRRRPRRWSPRVLAVAALLVLPTAAASGSATLLALRGSVIPAPRATPPEQTPAPGTSRLTDATAADPSRGRPRWALRLATSRTGLLCSTVGQQVGGRFGIVGLDGRFRALAPGVADACSLRREGAASLVGARVFDARRPGDVRTVVHGIGGGRLRAVEVEAAGTRRAVPVREGGAFVAALAGLPEDLGLRVRLRFAGGRREEHPFGVAPLVVPDPAGGRAWRVESAGIGGDPRHCIGLREARERPNPVLSPAVCGRLAGEGERSRGRGVFFGVRRVLPGTGGVPVDPFGEGRWQGTPPRLLVLGAAGEDVTSVDVRGPRGAARTSTWYRPNGAFAFVFGPEVRLGEVTVVVRFRDGRRLVRRTSTNVLPPPSFGGR